MASPRVVVGMSGGVDSSVAAARLQDSGYEVIGVTLHLWDYPDAASSTGPPRCCAPEDQYDARRTADALGFAHYTFDRRSLFEASVVQPFVESYLQGATPSPCSDCNRGVKMAELFVLADRLGAGFVATGHYARIVRNGQGGVALAKGRDPQKDQSYFLYEVPHDKLARLLFPLGDSSKEEVRQEAHTRSLPGAHKGESQELCFVGGGHATYSTFVEGRAGGKIRPGPIVDDTGREIGVHAGVHRFTVGQRKGLGVTQGKPLFVTQIDGVTGAVQVGGADRLLASGAELEQVVLAPGVTLPCRVDVRIRYRHEGVSAWVTPTASGCSLQFEVPTRAVTSGQTAVFYEGDLVRGGGRILRALPARIA